MRKICSINRRPCTPITSFRERLSAPKTSRRFSSMLTHYFHHTQETPRIYRLPTTEGRQISSVIGPVVAPSIKAPRTVTVYTLPMRKGRMSGLHCNCNRIAKGALDFAFRDVITFLTSPDVATLTKQVK